MISDSQALGFRWVIQFFCYSLRFPGGHNFDGEPAFQFQHSEAFVGVRSSLQLEAFGLLLELADHRIGKPTHFSWQTTKRTWKSCENHVTGVTA